MHYLPQSVFTAALLLNVGCSSADHVIAPVQASADTLVTSDTLSHRDTSAVQDTVTHPDTSVTHDTLPPPDSSATRDTLPPQDSSATPDTLATNECSARQAAWLFCDDFETNRLSQYFEYTDPNGSFTRAAGVGLGGSMGMRATFTAGQVDAGSLKLAFGKTPDPYIRPVDGGTTIYREIYWRMYVRNDSTWTGGGGDKLSRAQSLANSQWAQAMLAPIWSGGPTSGAQDYLLMDPATGISGDTLAETSYNDFAHQQYLGSRQGITPIFDAAHVGKWYCVEAHVRLNDAGQSNGVFEFWIDGQLQASRSDLNWVGGYTDYGINVVFFENYWNAGSPKTQSRYFDNIVVSTARIGCVQ